MLTGL